MSNIRKTPGSRAVIYDLTAVRQRNTANAAASRPADETGISEDARRLAQAREAVAQAADVRAAKVAALRARIARGDYRPDPQEVARKILEQGL